MEPYVLVFDVGTSALKAVLYAQNGELLEMEGVDYEYQCPRPRWAEIDPALWLNALWQCLAVLGEKHDLGKVRGISFTGQMHTAVLLDGEDRALSPSILWLDRRAEAETLELEEKFGLPPYMLNSTYTLPKLYWIKKHRPKLLEKTRKMIWPKDYLRLAFTGVVATDATEGIGAALLNWETGAWAPDRLSALGISPDILPGIIPAEAAAPIKADVAEKYGFAPDVKVFTGYGDIIALLGGAPHKPGRLVYSLGSSSMFFAQVDTPATGPQNSLYTLNLGGYHLFGGVSNTTGAALRWFGDAVFPGMEVNDIAARALQQQAGCDGLVFIPYLAGERSPYWSDSVAAGFYGLRLQHGTAHMARAVMEGVAYSIRHAMDLYAESGHPVTEIAMAAGGVRVQGWPRMIADVCGVPVVIYAAQETVAKVLFALCRSGLAGEDFSSILEKSFGEPRRLEPGAEDAAAYAKGYAAYRAFSKFAGEM